MTKAQAKQKGFPKAGSKQVYISFSGGKEACRAY